MRYHRKQVPLSRRRVTRLLGSTLGAALIVGTLAGSAGAAGLPVDNNPVNKTTLPAVGSPSADQAAANAAQAAPAVNIADPRPGLLHPITKHLDSAACGVAAPGQARCLSFVVHPQEDVPNANPNLPSGYGPADLKSAYALPTTLGAGNTVAIVDAYDYPNAAADLAVYRSTYSLPACGAGCFTKLNQTGATSPLPAANAGWQTEMALDLDMVSAVCPLCHIVLVEANDSGLSNLATAVNTAAAQPGVVAISNSYGAGEWSGETSLDASYNHGGILITASSGDSGYGVSYPAASANVTSVGGTHLVKNTSARGWVETAWSGAGSGCSAYETKPVWQHDSGCAKRTVADTSAVADTSTPVAIYNGGWGLVGGTSVASPIVASISALSTSDFRWNGAQGFYRLQGSLGINDVTSGSNGSCGGSYLCTAGAGYDGPTGVGTPYTQPRDSYGYVWASSPSVTTTYVPASTWNTNSYGSLNSILRTGVGSYRVLFPHLADGGTVNVTSYGTGNNCKVSGWYHSGIYEVVNVACYNTAGAAVDSYYDVSFVNPVGRVGSRNFAQDSLGFVWANSPSSASYTPSTYYAYNNFNQTNTIVRNGTGSYTITFPELAPTLSTNQGTVKVTAYGSGNAQCQSNGWSRPSTTNYNESVSVYCTTPTGVAIDSYFTASYSADLPLTGQSTSQNAYFWADQPTAASYTPAATWSFNSSGGANTVVRNATGSYSVTLPGMTLAGGNVQVTSYGSDGSRCFTTGWGSGSTGTSIGVHCVNAGGVAVDHYFNLQYYR